MGDFGVSHYLLILKAQQENLFHHSQLRLFTPLRALIHVPRVKRNLVSILAALVRRLWLVP